MWQYMPAIPALRWLRQEDFDFEASLGYIASSRPACDSVSKKKSLINCSNILEV
jgi:hypothetical protein